MSQKKAPSRKKKSARGDRNIPATLGYSLAALLVLAVVVYAAVTLVGEFRRSRTPSVITEPSAAATALAAMPEALGTEPAPDVTFGDPVQVPVSAEEASVSEEPKAKNASVTISFAGDCTFASYYGANYSNTFERVYEENGEDYFFQNVVDIFKADDLTVTNFEGTLTTSTERVYKTYNFKSDPSYVGILKAGDIECVNVANNHTHDYSESGYRDTINTLDEAGVKWFGEEDTLLLEVNGILLGFSGIYECERSLGCLDDAVSNVEKLKEAGAEVIICEFHWGDESSHRPNSYATTIAHAVVDAGADLIIGHHPHVLQGIELYKGKYICYSLGNFCFGGTPGGPDKDTMIFQATFTITEDTLQPMDYNIIPCSFSTETERNTYCPTPQEGDEAQRIMDNIYLYSSYLDGGISPNMDAYTDHDHIE